MNDLFPETVAEQAVNGPAAEFKLHSLRVDGYGHPVATLELIPRWSPKTGWTVGWLVRLERCLDEWHPNAPNEWRRHASYPWYRPDEMPCSGTLAVAAGTALRAAKLVLAQMKGWAPPELHEDADQLSQAAERLAMQLLVEGER